MRQIANPDDFVGWAKKAIVVLNWISVCVWLVLSSYIVVASWKFQDLVDNQWAFMSLCAARVVYGILSLAAGTALVNLLNPYINYVDLLRGDGLSKLSAAIIFASIVISISMIAGGVR